LRAAENRRPGVSGFGNGGITPGMESPSEVTGAAARAGCVAEGAPGARPQLVFFYSSRSGLCRRVEGYLAQILQRHQNHETFKLIRVPVEQHPNLAQLFAVDDLPTIVVLDGRQVRARLEAPRGRPAIERALAPWLR